VHCKLHVGDTRKEEAASWGILNVPHTANCPYRTEESFQKAGHRVSVRLGGTHSHWLQCSYADEDHKRCHWRELQNKSWDGTENECRTVNQMAAEWALAE
jgi:hypothetical protein